MRPQLLIIEDDPDIRTLIAHRLSKEGYEVLSAGTGEKGLELARSSRPALILLDLMLPGIQGLDVCRRLKGDKKTRQTPIIMLTAKGEETDIVVGLEVGADDYLVKPFGNRELLARIRAVLRRMDSSADVSSERAEDQTLSVGDVILDPIGFEVTVSGIPVVVTTTEFKLLHTLMMNKGKVLTREQLLSKITDPGTYIVDRNIDVHIRGLRKKIGKKEIPIETVRGIGYKLRDE